MVKEKQKCIYQTELWQGHSRLPEAKELLRQANER